MTADDVDAGIQALAIGLVLFSVLAFILISVAIGKALDSWKPYDQRKAHFDRLDRQAQRQQWTQEWEDGKNQQ